MTKKLLRQHNAITEARYEMTALEKDIVYLLISKIQETDEFGKEYLIHANELIKTIGNKTADALNKATIRLISRVYTIKEENGDLLQVSLMTVAKFCNKTKELRVKISKNILPYLISLKRNYTEFELNMALSLKGKYSKRLYEILSQHKGIGSFTISVKVLKERFKLIDKNKEKYEGWTAFEEAILIKPQSEICAKTDLTFTYEALKTGNKYTDINFKITVKAKQLRLDF